MDNNLPDIYSVFNEHLTKHDSNGDLQLYSSIFNNIRTNVVNVLVFTSSDSLLLSLRDYFVSGTIIGVTFDKLTLTDDVRISLISTEEDIEKELEKRKIKSLDVIIDDSQKNEEVRLSYLRNIFGKLVQDGIYIIEGLNNDNKIVACPGVINVLSNSETYFFSGINKKQCVIYNKKGSSRREVY